jgi:uncharacterized protein YjiS (DUF1127 family)
MNAHTKIPQLIILDQIAESIFQFFTNVLETLMHWEQNYRTRKELNEMEEYLLKDIGLSKIDVINETKKSFWQ